MYNGYKVLFRIGKWFLAVERYRIFIGRVNKNQSYSSWTLFNSGEEHWFRGQHELLLVGVRGKFSPPPQPLRISSVYREKRTKHSKKPNRIRDLIASWYPEATRLEMFSRQQTDGWDVWGNEIPSDVEVESDIKL